MNSMNSVNYVPLVKLADGCAIHISQNPAFHIYVSTKSRRPDCILQSANTVVEFLRSHRITSFKLDMNFGTFARYPRLPITVRLGFFSDLQVLKDEYCHPTRASAVDATDAVDAVDTSSLKPVPDFQCIVTDVPQRWADSES
jgi:hypothetical protein